MNYIIVGLGNPGEEYKNTRHNTGRVMLEHFRKKNGFSDWASDKKLKALVSAGKIGKGKVILVLPEIFMNNSGKSVASLVKNKKDAERLIVIYDDIDLPLGTFKISFNRGSGGHKGIESIVKTLKTREFVRVRVGISPATPSGRLKKPSGEKVVHDFIIGNFKEKEGEVMKKLSKKVIEAIEMIFSAGHEKAMSEFN